MDDRKPTSEEQEPAAPRTSEERESGAQEPGAPTKPRYEFKILPVDPKNSFDFEDVADK